MYFDLHCHPSFKSFLSNRDQSMRSSCWENFTFDISLGILNSQSSLDQMKKGKIKLAVAVLYGLEWGFARTGIIKLAAGLSPNIQKRFIQAIERKDYGYNELMHSEYRHLVMSTNDPASDEVVIVNNIQTDFNANDDKLHLILAVEGGHNFYDDKQIVLDPQIVIQNLRFFKDPSNPRLLYVTLTHISKSEYCTHAFGMKMINHPVFYPEKKGITALGKNFIREALSTTNGRRILIDIKHMSLIARLEFYKMRNAEFPDAPIMASHMGVNGVSYMKKPIKKVKENHDKNCVDVSYYRSLGVLDTYFNPWSINLYDEDIIEIAKSGGLIGMSLDQRILGVGNVSKELFSPEEVETGNFAEIKKTKYHKLDYDLLNRPSEKRKWHMRHLCNNIIHIVKIGHQAIGDDIWNHICIGSDLDGLINTIDSFKSSEDYPNLFGDMVEQLPLVAAAANIHLSSTQIQTKIKQILFENALNFLKKHYS